MSLPKTPKTDPVLRKKVTGKSIEEIISSGIKLFYLK
jgi:hypothetical protein